MTTETPTSNNSGGVGFPKEKQITSQEVVIRPPRKKPEKCQVCGLKYRAGTHERVCRKQHRIKWLIKDIKGKIK